MPCDPKSEALGGPLTSKVCRGETRGDDVDDFRRVLLAWRIRAGQEFERDLDRRGGGQLSLRCRP